MHPPYRYAAHGLAIASDVELPELEAAAGPPDVVISIGEAPRSLAGPITRGPGYQATPDHCLFDLRGVGRYLVSHGRQIVISRDPAASDDAIRMFVLSSIMAALMHQRGRLAMHASGIETGGRCVLFGGVSGAGKSTLAAAFHARGHRLVTDDVSVIDFDSAGLPLVSPGYRRVKLRDDAAARLSGALGDRRPAPGSAAKSILAVNGPAPPHALPVERVYSLAAEASEGIALETLTGRAKLRALIRDTYRHRMLIALGRRKTHFEQCTQLARRVSVVRVTRPADLNRLPELVEAIAQDLAHAAGQPA